MATTTFTDNVTLVVAAFMNDVDTATYAYLTGVAGTDTITATGPKNAALAAGLLLRFTPAGTNTGATTLNVTPSGSSALGAKNVFCNGAACVGGEIVSGVPCEVMYDGTQFNLLGPRPIATQAQQEAGTNVVNAVSPGRQQFHPSAAKGWVNFNGTGTAAIVVSYNVTSLTDEGTGDFTVTWATDFASANYALAGWVGGAAGSSTGLMSGSSAADPVAGSVRVRTTVAGSGTDCSVSTLVAFGDQA